MYMGLGNFFSICIYLFFKLTLSTNHCFCSRQMLSYEAERASDVSVINWKGLGL